MSRQPLDAHALAEAYERLLDGDATKGDIRRIGEAVVRAAGDQRREEERLAAGKPTDREVVEAALRILFSHHATQDDRDTLLWALASANLRTVRREIYRRTLLQSTKGIDHAH